MQWPTGTLISVMLMNIFHAQKHFNSELEVTNQTFLEPSHIHMEADSINVAIKKTKKNTTAKIDTHRDWVNLIRLVPRKPTMKVMELEQKYFLNFSELLHGCYDHRKQNILGESVPWLKIKWLQYRHDSPGNAFYKVSFSLQAEFKTLNLTRRGRHPVNHDVQPIHMTSTCLSAEKVKDLQSLMPFIHSQSRPFYQNMLPVRQGDSVEYFPNESDDE
ncbi:hypothetical protein PR048_009176 [Dryococelus australis]|uniref:Uncharacterized protein n=1 Tax=Dryococelus australis TaxID=614101 RepID=A0ABQ9I087_9NEOP|nr:hypothetical protein PR048_009176 [Dryococelus australis]